MDDVLISINKAVARAEEVCLAQPVSWDIRRGEQWAVVGPNGSGKNILAGLIQGRYPLKEGQIRYSLKDKPYNSIKSISFNDIHSIADTRNSYYQQRWHATETDEMPTVGELLPADCNTVDDEAFHDIFGIKKHLNSKIMHLSSGELRKFLIIRALLSQPEILIIDNPYIGLDAPSRGVLSALFEQIAQSGHTQMILLLSDPVDIPTVITNIIHVPANRPAPLRTGYIQLPENGKAKSCHTATFRMENLTVAYGGRTILEGVNWEALNGEKWALLGPNGSGKTLLLSLIYADNPQAYAQKIYVFDRRRGTGESIWDVKSRIGYVSPEMHLYYRENALAIDIVQSGFFDTTGLYRRCSDEQAATAALWMQIFGIKHIADRRFPTLSTGEQRLVLLARSFVKDPDLLILDEPLHGLDADNKRLVTQIIETFSNRPGKTLVYVTHYPAELPPCITKIKQLHR